MYKELEKLINSVIEKATDDSETSWYLVEDLVSYYYDHYANDCQYLDEFMEALKVSAEKDCRWAKVKISEAVFHFGGSKDMKWLASQYGKESGLVLGFYFAARILEDPEFRPRDYFFNERAGLLGGHMPNEPDFSLRDAADCYQVVIDSFDPDDDEFNKFQDYIIDSATKAALLFLNKRGFGPGIPIDPDNELKAYNDLNLVIKKGNPEQIAYASSILGAAELKSGNFDIASDLFIQALDKDPEAILYFYKESGFPKESEALNKLITACEKTIYLTRIFRSPQESDRLNRVLNYFKSLNC